MLGIIICFLHVGRAQTGLNPDIWLNIYIFKSCIKCPKKLQVYCMTFVITASYNGCWSRTLKLLYKYNITVIKYISKHIVIPILDQEILIYKVLSRHIVI